MTKPSPASSQSVSATIDTGPLSWVMGEIRETLTRSRAALSEALAQDDEDARSASLRRARSDLHQAHGALQIVDIEGLATLTGTAEDLLDRIDAGKLTLTAELASAVEQAYRALVEYLEELLSGDLHQPVRLYPYYRALLEARGEERIHPADLFFPDLTLFPQLPSSGMAVEAATADYANLRQRFERALLPFLKGIDRETEMMHAIVMRNLIGEVEQMQTHPSARAFWWVMHGFAEAVASNQISNGIYVKQLFGLINLQIRRLSQGASNSPEKVLRDALFLIAQIAEPSPLAQQIRAAYRLDGMVPADYEKKRYGRIDIDALVAAKERLSAVKNLWNRIASGDAGPAASFDSEMQTLVGAGARLNVVPLTKLLRELNGIAKHAVRANPGEAIGLELATALLFIENTLNNIGHLPENFAERADALTARLLSVMEGETPSQPAQWLDDISREAQQRQTMAALSAEMQASLRQVEKTLDEYFRDPKQNTALEPLDTTLHQIEGALAILDLDEAMRAVRHTRAAVQRFAASYSGERDEQEFRNVAQNIGAISFFIEALQHDPRAMSKRYVFDEESGIFRAHLLENAEEQANSPTAEEESVRHPQQSAEVSSQNESDTFILQDGLKESLDQIQLEVSSMDASDAKESAKRSIGFLATLDLDDSTDELADGASAIKTEHHVAVSESPVLPASDEEIDAELLDIFLTEAVEVLACIRETLPQSRQAPHDQEHLITLRRSFHTLKGSSRMVGLTAFGEAAWSIEQVMNLRLAESHGGDDDLHALLEKAVSLLSAWVDDLRLRGRSGRTPNALIAAAERVKDGDGFHFDDEVAEASSMELMPLELTPVTSGMHAEVVDDEPDLPALLQAEEVQLSEADLAMFLPSSDKEGLASENVEAPSDKENSKRIGDVEISLALYNIYLGETDGLVRHLAQDFAEWRHEPERAVSTRSLNAAHSLAGSSATVGFMSLHEVAYALEMLLQFLARTPIAPNAHEFDMLIHTVERIRLMLQQFTLGEMAAEEPEYARLLLGLKQAMEARIATPTEPLQQSSTRVAFAPPASDETPMPQDEIDADLLPVFLEEGQDMLPHMGQALRLWPEQLTSQGLPQSLLRVLHTLKGSARMAGAMRLGQHLHDMETRIENLMRAGMPSKGAVEDLLIRYDQALYLFEQLQRPVVPEQAAPVATPETGPVVLPSLVPLQAEPRSSSPQAATESPAAAPLPPSPLVRVRADLLDRLVNQAGEVSISRSRLETDVGSLRQSLSEMTENVARLREQLRELEMQAESQIASSKAQSSDREFDPLEFDRFTRLQELTRMMAESVADVGSVQQSLSRTVEAATGDLSVQARLTRELQQDLMRVRMVQFASVSERLFRVSRQTSKELDKRVNLDIRGGAVELDRGVLEKMTGPFEHLLRNAIVHGIESREARRVAGKNDTGELLVEVRQEGNEVVIQFSDDGQGLNLNSIRDKAKSAGLLTDESKLSDDEVRDLIFQPGFSTADEITELAGRGVGMDVVRSEAAALGGRVSIRSVEGKGAQFTIHLPLTLAVTQVVLIATGGKTYAVPSALVEQVQQLKANPLVAAYNDGAVVWQGQRVPMYYLPTLLGDNMASPVAQQYSPLMILRSGNERVALHVDEIIGNREVVVKNIGPQLARLVGIAGATVLGSGDIVLILNPVPLAQRASHNDIRAPRILGADLPSGMGAVAELPVQAHSNVAAVQGLRTQKIVMVVDDSLTVRRVTQRLLSREGYQVVLAKDGVDALQHLQSIKPDVMLLDIEMPRMDGFDLTRNVRADDRTRDIPIIMITSRTAAKHRNYAMELGVNEYLGKPYHEQQLLDLIAGFVGTEASVE